MVAKNINLQDIDPVETQEWKEAFDSVVEYENVDRAEFILEKLLAHARNVGVSVPTGIHTPYLNTIPAETEAQLADDEIKVMQRLTNYLRWNALAMVMRVGRKKSGVGGGIFPVTRRWRLYLKSA